MKTNQVLLISLLAFFVFGSCNKKEDLVPKTKKETIQNADDFLLKDTAPTEIMLLGSWHFAFYNNDSHKIKESNKVDYTSTEKQIEIIDVVNKLKAFKPTIICIERQNQKKTDSLYTAYLSGNYELSVDEEQQIGFRIAKQLQLKKIYAVDNSSWLRDNYKEFPVLDNLWDEEQYLDTLVMNNWNTKYEKWYSYQDKILSEKSVEECLKIYNNPLNIQRGLGHYLVTLKTKNDNGPDSYSLKWYDRNVRIFNNILKTNPNSKDRILVIYGAGHIPILEQLFVASPQFKLKRPYNYN